MPDRRAAILGGTARRAARSAAPGGERGDVGFTREQELPESEPTVAERLIDAQQDQVVPEALLAEGTRPLHPLPAGHEPLDRVLGVVVVPGDPIVVQEGE